MAKRNKLMKFAEMKTFPNVFEVFDMKNPEMTSQGNIVSLKGKWASEHFKNDKPICVELACGRGEYSLGLAKLNPEVNYIGVDIKGARIWRGATNAINDGLENVAFLRTKIEIIKHFFDPGEIDEIWITFPDPFLSKPNRRLTAQIFLDRYRALIGTNKYINLKTDSRELYDFSKEMIEENGKITIHKDIDDIYSLPEIEENLLIQTYYERQHLAKGKKITYLRFSFHE